MRNTKAASGAVKTPTIIPYAEVEKLTEAQRIAQFSEQAIAGQRAFSVMGKLFRSLQASLKKPKTVFGELQKAGIKKGTISNASYAAKVFDLVTAKVITEKEFDSLSFGDCLSIIRVTSQGSRKMLSVQQVAAGLRADSIGFAENFTSLYETGLTLKEAAAAEKERKAQAERAEKERLDRERKAEADRVQREKERDKEIARLRAEQAKKPSATPPAAAPANASNGATPPSNITPMPRPDAAATPSATTGKAEGGPQTSESAAPQSTEHLEQLANDALDHLEEVRAILGQLRNAQAKPVVSRLIEMADEGFGLTAEGAGERVDVLGPQKKAA